MDLFKKKYTIIELFQWRHFVSACRVRQVNPSISTAGQWESLWDGKIQNAKVEDGSEVGGSRAHFPSTPVKYLADLRSRANSQQYSSIYEDQRPKIEDIERSDGKKSA